MEIFDEFFKCRRNTESRNEMRRKEKKLCLTGRAFFLSERRHPACKRSSASGELNLNSNHFPI